MKVVECGGTFREIGRATGEALREEIALSLEIWSAEGKDATKFEGRIPAFERSLRESMPEVLDEMVGTAEGAAVPVEEIYRMNLPLYNATLDGGPEANHESGPSQGCTNLAFAAGADGPVLGKNNDMGEPLGDPGALPYVLRIARPAQGIPTATITFCGMIATLDAMNAEGLSMGHSSVGSAFQQSDSHIPIRLWGYVGFLRCRTTAELIRHMISRPLRGKGYTAICVDADGAMCAIEAPCPLVQVRTPATEAGMNAVNYYQLPSLERADQRSDRGHANSEARRRFLDGILSDGPGSTPAPVDRMKQILAHHGDPSICRHGGADGSFTTFSMIIEPQQRRLQYLLGNPCSEVYAELRL